MKTFVKILAGAILMASTTFSFPLAPITKRVGLIFPPSGGSMEDASDFKGPQYDILELLDDIETKKALLVSPLKDFSNVPDNIRSYMNPNLERRGSDLGFGLSRELFLNGLKNHPKERAKLEKAFKVLDKVEHDVVEKIFYGIRRSAFHPPLNTNSTDPLV